MEPGRNSEMSIHSEKMTHPRTPPQRATAQAREAAIVTIHPAPGNDRIQKRTGDVVWSKTQRQVCQMQHRL